MAMAKNNVRCVYCGKDLGGFIFEHNCEKKANNRSIWDAKRIGRKGNSKEKIKI